MRLFERNRNEVIITPAGEAIIVQAQDVLRAAEVLRETAEATRDPLGIRLVLVIYTVAASSCRASSPRSKPSPQAR